MTLQEFVDKWLGKKCDFDGFYAGQCVDLYRMYVKEVLGFPQSPGVTGAAEIWDTYLKDKFDRISNTPTGVPVAGDIPIWNKNAGAGFGHIDIFLEGNANEFTGLDQNWPTLSKVTKTKHNYTNVLGWLHPKGEPMSEIDDLKLRVVSLEKEVAEKNTQIGNYVNQVKGLEQKVKEEYARGFLEGKASVVVPPVVIGWEENGLTIETTNGNEKRIVNYKRSV